MLGPRGSSGNRPPERVRPRRTGNSPWPRCLRVVCYPTLAAGVFRATGGRRGERCDLETRGGARIYPTPTGGRTLAPPAPGAPPGKGETATPLAPIAPH